MDGIVKIYTHFQENNTAYLVMEYLDGRNLKSFVKNKGGSISSKLAGRIIIKAAAALEKVHSANVLHRDISPENIFIMRNDVDVKLIDFGAARRNVEDSNQEKSVLLKPGFAPPEQYSKRAIKELGQMFMLWRHLCTISFQALFRQIQCRECSMTM